MPSSPLPPRDKLQILAFTNGTASRVWRFDPIAERLNEQTVHEMFVAEHSQWNGKTLGANLVILQMLTGPHVVDTCHNLGAKVIYEADDAVIDTYGRERKNLQHIGPNWRRNAIETIRKCDAITVTNKMLAENYARFTDKPVFVLPIFMDDRYYGEAVAMKPPKRTTDEIRIGWFGSKGHYEDLRMIVPALEEIITKYRNAKFVYCGFGGMSSDKLVTEVGWGEDVFRELSRGRREFVIGASELVWPWKHRTLDFDIGLCPLVDDEFNHNKVATKWLEYSAFSIPAICSPTVYDESPYGPGHPPVVYDGRTGFIAKTTRDWMKYLALLIENEPLRRGVGERAAEEVMLRWNIDQHWTAWEDVYKETAFG